RFAADMRLVEARHKGAALRQWVSNLLLLTFVARVLVPAGYMPDFSAASEGSFKVVICSAMNAKTIVLDDSGKPLSDQGQEHHHQPCWFLGSSAVVIPELEAIQFVTRDFEYSNLSPRIAVQLPPTRAGPQLGSRGPPQVL
ncbi:MAG: hypothetical protein ABL907_03805, partial [Hyphomicrobium sp.]